MTVITRVQASRYPCQHKLPEPEAAAKRAARSPCQQRLPEGATHGPHGTWAAVFFPFASKPKSGHQPGMSQYCSTGKAEPGCLKKPKLNQCQPSHKSGQATQAEPSAEPQFFQNRMPLGTSVGGPANRTGLHQAQLVSRQSGRRGRRLEGCWWTGLHQQLVSRQSGRRGRGPRRPRGRRLVEHGWWWARRGVTSAAWWTFGRGAWRWGLRPSTLGELGWWWARRGVTSAAWPAATGHAHQKKASKSFEPSVDSPEQISNASAI